MRISRLQLLAALLSVSLAACDGGRLVAVDLYSDLAPGSDFDEIEVTLSERLDDGTLNVVATRPVAAQAGWAIDDGARLTDFDGVAPGTVLVRADLRLRGELVLRRAVMAEGAGDMVVSVLVTGACRGVRCPGAGDDALRNARVPAGRVLGAVPDPGVRRQLPALLRVLLKSETVTPARRTPRRAGAA